MKSCDIFIVVFFKKEKKIKMLYFLEKLKKQISTIIRRIIVNINR